MKLALIGYGKMGKIIEEATLERGHTISFRIDIDNLNDFNKLDPANTDVAIEFSQPGAAYDNIMACLRQRVAVISGTTGWLDKKDEIEKSCRELNGTFFYASNYSIGVNILFRVNEFLARIMDGYPAYEVGITEIHHTEKKDAPSGTAISLAEGIVANLKRKNGWTGDDKENPSKISIRSLREGKVPGTHFIKYRSDADEIELKHEAFGRKGFAIGAVMVAEWIAGKRGIFSMKDFLDL
ncbi:MAG TPA: 4-hydroxy-tetrahydrodipicolinate reductase [Cyclobacteriaceae bacterium]|nr:4-hydroxy-tetrahydrodipicolinate reductase [Cyclobacteriaceae bacterium]